MTRGFHASSFAIVSLAAAGVLATVGCEVGYQPRPAYARPLYYAPPPRTAPPPGQPAYGQPAPSYAPPPQGGPAPQGGPPRDAPCIDPGPQDIPDRFDAAMRIEAQSQTVGCVSPNDVDMFVVSAPPAKAGVIIRFSLQGSNTIAPKIKILDADRKYQMQTSGPNAGELHGWAHVAGGTTIYFEASQVYWSKGQYTLTLTAEPLKDPDEPNDDIDHPTVIHEGTPVNVFMSAEMNNVASANDYYKIELHHDGPVTFDLDMVQGISPKIIVSDVDRRIVSQQSGQNAEHMHRTFKLRHGLYYVRIFPFFEVSSAGAGELPVRLERQYKFTILPGHE